MPCYLSSRRHPGPPSQKLRRDTPERFQFAIANPTIYVVVVDFPALPAKAGRESINHFSDFSTFAWRTRANWLAGVFNNVTSLVAGAFKSPRNFDLSTSMDGKSA